MTHETESDDGGSIDINTAVLNATETAVEAAIQRGEATPGSFPYFEAYSSADDAAQALTNAAVPCLFPKPSYENTPPRLPRTTDNPHAEQRSRQRVIDNAVNNGGEL